MQEHKCRVIAEKNGWLGGCWIRLHGLKWMPVYIKKWKQIGSWHCQIKPCWTNSGTLVLCNCKLQMSWYSIFGFTSSGRRVDVAPPPWIFMDDSWLLFRWKTLISNLPNSYINGEFLEQFVWMGSKGCINYCLRGGCVCFLVIELIKCSS